MRHLRGIYVMLLLFGCLEWMQGQTATERCKKYILLYFDQTESVYKYKTQVVKGLSESMRQVLRNQEVISTGDQIAFKSFHKNVESKGDFTVDNSDRRALIGRFDDLVAESNVKTGSDNDYALLFRTIDNDIYHLQAEVGEDDLIFIFVFSDFMYDSKNGTSDNLKKVQDEQGYQELVTTLNNTDLQVKVFYFYQPNNPKPNTTYHYDFGAQVLEGRQGASQNDEVINLSKRRDLTESIPKMTQFIIKKIDAGIDVRPGDKGLVLTGQNEGQLEIVIKNKKCLDDAVITDIHILPNPTLEEENLRFDDLKIPRTKDTTVLLKLKTKKPNGKVLKEGLDTIGVQLTSRSGTQDFRLKVGSARYEPPEVSIIEVRDIDVKLLKQMKFLRVEFEVDHDDFLEDEFVLNISAVGCDDFKGKRTIKPGEICRHTVDLTYDDGSCLKRMVQQDSIEFEFWIENGSELGIINPPNKKAKIHWTRTWDLILAIVLFAAAASIISLGLYWFFMHRITEENRKHG